MAQFDVETSNPHPGFDVVRVRRGERLKLPQGGVIRARICQSFGFGPWIGRLLGHEQGQTKNRGGYEDHFGESSLVQPPAHRPDRVIRSNAEGTTFFGRATSHFSEGRSSFYRVLAEFAAIDLAGGYICICGKGPPSRRHCWEPRAPGRHFCRPCTRKRRRRAPPRALEILAGRGSQIGVTVRDVDEADTKTSKLPSLIGRLDRRCRAQTVPRRRRDSRKATSSLSSTASACAACVSSRGWCRKRPPGSRIQTGVMRDGQHVARHGRAARERQRSVSMPTETSSACFAISRETSRSTCRGPHRPAPSAARRRHRLPPAFSRWRHVHLALQYQSRNHGRRSCRRSSPSILGPRTVCS